MRQISLTPLILWLVLTGHYLADDLEWLRVAGDNCSFLLEESGRKFVPWGFNYDQQAGSGRLIEDYWDEEWTTIEEDFLQMKQLGANVVRIHLQFGSFMEAADQPNKHSLNQLGRLVKLAERMRLYVDLTGLGCYHKKDVPPWYDELDEPKRWDAQAAFWEAVAARCAKSPAIFCYDLMNEPVVPGDKKREDWLAGPFGGKHFVQFITLSAAGRPRHEVARKWIRHLVTAIRKHDRRHLVTVGLVPWSLDRLGLTSGFIPEKVTGDLDFIAVHIYPKSGKMDEAVKTVKAFAAVGKPVVIEEIFPLRCGAEELGQFIDESRKHASGWIGFYWGKKPEEYRPPKTVREATVLSWLDLFHKKGKTLLPPSLFGSVQCAGTYRHHLQGICTNEKDAIFWSFTTTLVKTDRQGRVLKKVAVENHHGDICFHDGQLYVAVNLGRFNDPQGNADSWVCVYDPADLSFVAKHKTPEVLHGAGGIAYHDGKFIVVGGLPEGMEANYVYEYDSQFKFMKKHIIKSGYTRLGIQTAAFSDGCWWFGCYGNKLLLADESFNLVGKSDFGCGLGIAGIGSDRFLIGRGGGAGEIRTGKALVAKKDETIGLVIDTEPEHEPSQ